MHHDWRPRRTCELDAGILDASVPPRAASSGFGWARSANLFATASSDAKGVDRGWLEMAFKASAAATAAAVSVNTSTCSRTCERIDRCTVDRATAAMALRSPHCARRATRCQCGLRGGHVTDSRIGRARAGRCGPAAAVSACSQHSISAPACCLMPSRARRWIM